MADISVLAVLCDMDGTLVDSNALVDVMWNEFAVHHGFDSAQVRAYAHGRPSRATINHYLREPEQVLHWIDHIHAQEANSFDGVVEIPGAAAFTRALPADRWALVTSALAGPARARLHAAGIELPRVVIGADDVEEGKPHPEGYARAARELGVDGSQCVVFEDTDAGIEAGRAAGCAVVVVGANRSPVTAGLPRVADMTEVRVRVEGASIVLTVPDNAQ